MVGDLETFLLGARAAARVRHLARRWRSTKAVSPPSRAIERSFDKRKEVARQRPYIERRSSRHIAVQKYLSFDFVI
jgi:hypothetical protein